MQRCLELAERGLGETLTNPMVGCVIVHNDLIIAEGWHHKFGEAHAERNAISALNNDHRLVDSTLYVNLEPCSHHGKTPPCAELIAASGIKKVVFGMVDPFEEVSGRGIAYLRDKGVEVVGPVLEKKSKILNKRFIAFHTKKRPYIILKWAQSADGFMAPESLERVQISGDNARRLLHRWRSEEGSVLVGAGTVAMDNPQLDVRYWNGQTKWRIFLDGSLRNNYSKSDVPTIVFNHIKSAQNGSAEFVKLEAENMLPEVIQHLYEKKVASVLVEGGRVTLQHFLDAGLWDEIRMVESKSVHLNKGILAPGVDFDWHRTEDMKTDTIKYYYRDLVVG